MSDDLDIRGGGAIAVDTATVYATATAFETVGADLDSIRAEMARFLNELLPHWVGSHVQSTVAAISACDVKMRDAVAQAERITGDLRAAGAIYELVEIDAAHAAAVAAGDAAEVAALERRRAMVRDEFPEAGDEAFWLQFNRAGLWPGNIVRQATEGGQSVGGILDELGLAAKLGGTFWTAALGVGAGGAAIAGATVFGVGGWGRLPRGARLTGAPTPVTVKMMPVTPAPATRPTPPAGLAAAASRIPNTGPAQVRVEKYTMADGSKQFAVYVSGTRTISAAAGSKEPWDMRSNAALYRGETAASFTATKAALAAAGAAPGATVHAFGHSQGGMIASHLALDDEYDVKTLVTLGAPVEADVGDGTFSAVIRHTDDPVGMLAGGGHMDSVGAPGSFVAEREIDADATLEDLALKAHHLKGYLETVTLVEESGDPRVAQLDGIFEQLAEASSMEAFEFQAERAEASPSPGGEG